MLTASKLANTIQVFNLLYRKETHPHYYAGDRSRPTESGCRKVEQLVKLATLVRAKERASLSQVLSTFDTNLNVATCWGFFWKINRLSNNFRQMIQSKTNG